MGYKLPRLQIAIRNTKNWSILTTIWQLQLNMRYLPFLFFLIGCGNDVCQPYITQAKVCQKDLEIEEESSKRWQEDYYNKSCYPTDSE